MSEEAAKNNELLCFLNISQKLLHILSVFPTFDQLKRGRTRSEVPLLMVFGLLKARQCFMNSSDNLLPLSVPTGSLRLLARISPKKTFLQPFFSSVSLSDITYEQHQLNA